MFGSNRHLCQALSTNLRKQDKQCIDTNTSITQVVVICMIESQSAQTGPIREELDDAVWHSYVGDKTCPPSDKRKKTKTIDSAKCKTWITSSKKETMIKETTAFKHNTLHVQNYSYSQQNHILVLKRKILWHKGVHLRLQTAQSNVPNHDFRQGNIKWW